MGAQSAVIFQRRSEMLHELAMGVPFAEITKVLSAKYGVKRDTIYQDWHKRDTWIQQVTKLDDPETYVAELLDMLQWVKKRAVLEILQGDNSNARIGAMRVIESLIGRMFEIAKATGKISTLPDAHEIMVSWMNDEPEINTNKVSASPKTTGVPQQQSKVQSS